MKKGREAGVEEVRSRRVQRRRRAAWRAALEVVVGKISGGRRSKSSGSKEREAGVKVVGFKGAGGRRSKSSSSKKQKKSKIKVAAGKRVEQGIEIGFQKSRRAAQRVACGIVMVEEAAEPRGDWICRGRRQIRRGRRSSRALRRMACGFVVVEGRFVVVEAAAEQRGEWHGRRSCRAARRTA